tara:strand:- start:22 stop:264 length:243 start_codon:yes stop_codon:yes gene_type:complete
MASSISSIIPRLVEKNINRVTNIPLQQHVNKNIQPFKILSEENKKEFNEPLKKKYDITKHDPVKCNCKCIWCGWPQNQEI